MPKPDESATVHVRPEVLQRYQELAAATGVPASAYMREALAEWLHRHVAPRPPVPEELQPLDCRS